jgi:hypothetical protein
MLKDTLERRFGAVASLRIVRPKGCAFLDFESVNAAQQAIAASLPVSASGEGGVRIDLLEDVQASVVVEAYNDRSEKPSGARSGSGAKDADVLADTVAGISLDSAPMLCVISAGAPPPSSGLLELNTRSTKTAPNFKTAEALPLLMLSGTAAVVLGIHEQGAFGLLRRIACDDPALEAARVQAQPALKRLRRVLEEVQDLMLGDALGKKVSFVCRDGVFQAYERNTEVGMLPDEHAKRFEA